MILITGATGLVGTHLLAQLLEKTSSSMLKPIYRTSEKKTYCLKIIGEVYGKDTLKKAEQCAWTKGDIMNIPLMTDAFKDVSYVYNCAGFISNSPSDRRKLRKINIEGVENMVNLAIDFGIKKFLHVSSIASLGKPMKGKLITENNFKESLQNGSFYSLSKFGGEMQVWRGSQEGLNVVIVNPGVILGEGFYSSGSGKLFHEANKNFPFYLTKTTGFTDVKYLSKIMVLLMNDDVISERYIIINENRDFGEIQQNIAAQLGKKRPFIKLSKWMLYGLWFADLLTSFFRKRLLTRDVVEGLLKSSYYDNTKLKKRFQLENNSIDTSINRIAQHFIKTMNKS